MKNSKVIPVVVFKYDLNAIHIRRALWENFVSSPIIRRNNVGVFWLGVLICLNIAWLHLLDIITEPELYFYCKITAIIFGAGFLLEFLLQWYGVRILASRPSYQRIFGEFEIKFSEEGIESISNTGKGNSTWEVIESLRFSKNFLFITLYNGTLIALPRNTENEESLQKIHKLYDAHQSKEPLRSAI